MPPDQPGIFGKRANAPPRATRGWAWSQQISAADFHRGSGAGRAGSLRFVSLLSPIEADEALHAAGAGRPVVVFLPSFRVVLDLLRTDDIVGLVPRRMMRGRHDDFRAVLPPVRTAAFDVIACWQPRMSHHPVHIWLPGELTRMARTMVSPDTPESL